MPRVTYQISFEVSDETRDFAAEQTRQNLVKFADKLRSVIGQRAQVTEYYAPEAQPAEREEKGNLDKQVLAAFEELQGKIREIADLRVAAEWEAYPWNAAAFTLVELLYPVEAAIFATHGVTATQQFNKSFLEQFHKYQMQHTIVPSSCKVTT